MTIMKHHNDFAVKDGCIGIINCWRFRNLWLFMNMEKGIVEELATLDGVRVISREEFDGLYKQRNVREGNERERMYGRVHEAYLKIWTDGTTHKTGRYSAEFARGYAFCVATIRTAEEFAKNGIDRGSVRDDQKGIAKEIVVRCHMSPDSVYSELCTRGFDEDVSEEEIVENLRKYLTLPAAWREHHMDSPELKHFLALASENTNHSL